MACAASTKSAAIPDEIKRAARLDPEVELRPERFGALAYHFGTRRLSFVRRRADAVRSLADEFETGLDAPICLTWELTYACNLACVHCLSSSGRRDPRELTTAECMTVIDELERMQVFYVNIGGGEPTVRRDFWELVDYAVAHHVGVKFSTNGSRITASHAERLARSDYVDVQVSLDGATAEVNDRIRGVGSYDTALTAMEHLANAGFKGFKLSVVVTRENVSQLDAFKALADRFEAQLRITRLRPSGRGADVWPVLHPTAAQQRELYEWLLAHGEDVLTGDSFFHLSGYGTPLPGLNLCGAGRVVCLIDPIGDVYACPFVIHDEFLAGNVREPGGFARVWRESDLFTDLRRPQSAGACSSCGLFDKCRGGCMAAKFFTGLPLAGPDPECVLGHGEKLLAERGEAPVPRPSVDMSKRRPPAKACNESPLEVVPAR
jgi:mycofactocin biosynthetic radical S-adenosylmethionine protein MftC